MYLNGLEHFRREDHPLLNSICKVDAVFASGGSNADLTIDNLVEFTGEQRTRIESVMELLLEVRAVEARHEVRCSNYETTFPVGGPPPDSSEGRCKFCGGNSEVINCEKIVRYRRAVIGDSSMVQVSSEVEIEGVHLLYRSSHAMPVGEVIFIHGLGGDWAESWQHSNSFSWPKRLGMVYERVNVWSIEVRLPLLKGRADALPLQDLGRQLGQRLAVGINTNLPMCFVVHSMGGLIFKQMIRAATDRPDSDIGKIPPRVRGVMFCGTPHSGAALANLAAMLPRSLGMSRAVKILSRDDASLRDLNEHYRSWHEKRQPCTRIIYETRALVLKHKLIEWILVRSWKFRSVLERAIGLFSLGKIVSESSADAGLTGCVAMPVDRDHIELVKPTNSKDEIFVHSIAWLDQSLQSK